MAHALLLLRMLVYDPETGLALLAEKDLSRAILVDLSLSVDPEGDAPWLRDNRSLVVITGYVEESDVSGCLGSIRAVGRTDVFLWPHHRQSCLFPRSRTAHLSPAKS